MYRILLIAIILSTSLVDALTQDLQALKIIKDVNEQLNQNTSFQYNYTYKGWGKNYGNFMGKVYIDKHSRVQLVVSLMTLDESGKMILNEDIYTNGDQIKVLDKTNKVLKTGSASKGSGYLMSYAWYAVFRVFLMPNPMAMNYENKTLAYVGSKKIKGVDCHLVSYVNPWGDGNTWYIGKNDHQIYGQKVENNNPGTEGGFEFIMTSSQFNQPIDPEVFDINTDGVRVVDEDNRSITPGNMAPEWTLKNDEHLSVSNRQLRGKIVLLDFWASWCSPCWQIMPIIDKIKTDYQNNDLEVYGVNVWENPKIDIKAYLERKNLKGYDILFDTDASVAKSFKIGTLPFIVLISENGEILYINDGRDAQMDHNIRAILDQQ